MTAPIGIQASPNRTVEMIGLPMRADNVHDPAPYAKQTMEITPTRNFPNTDPKRAPINVPAKTAVNKKTLHFYTTNIVSKRG